MKNVTSGYKNAICTLGREINAQITYSSNNQQIILGAEDINSVVYKYDGSILKSVMTGIDIDSNVEIPQGTIVNCQFGLKVGNSYEYIDFGNFIVNKVEKQEDTDSYNITCYDKMLYSMKDYEAMNISYPITIRDYIGAICTHLGITFANSSDTFANYDKEIQKELYLDTEGNSLNYTFRDVFDDIAQATASTICMNSDDELEIRYINNTNDTIDEEFLKNVNVKFGKKYGPINSIVLSRADGADNVYLRNEQSVTQNGLCEIKIAENQIMNFNDRSDYLQDILDTLDGLEYYINDYSSTGVTYYELCDKYNVTIGNKTYSCIMLSDEINITQGLVENIHADMPDESETDYTKADKTDRKINQTYIIANKQEGKIEALTTETQVLQENMGNTYTKEQVNELIQTAQEGLVNTFTISGGNNLLRNTAPYFMTSDDEAEYWEGHVKQVIDADSTSGYALGIQNGILKQSVVLVNGAYSLSFRYKRNNTASTCQVRYNGRSIDLNNDDGEIHTSGEVSTGQMIIEIEANANDNFEIYDLILKHGNEGEENMLVWTQNANESISDTVQISQGITALSNATDTKATMDSLGFMVKNKTTGTPVMEATSTGGRFLDLTSTGKSNISGLIIEKHDRQIWGTGG